MFDISEFNEILQDENRDQHFEKHGGLLSELAMPEFNCIVTITGVRERKRVIEASPAECVDILLTIKRGHQVGLRHMEILKDYGNVHFMGRETTIGKMKLMLIARACGLTKIESNGKMSFQPFVCEDLEGREFKCNIIKRSYRGKFHYRVEKIRKPYES